MANPYDIGLDKNPANYQPLTPLEHAMPAYTLEHSYQGKGLGTLWSAPQQRWPFALTVA